MGFVIECPVSFYVKCAIPYPIVASCNVVTFVELVVNSECFALHVWIMQYHLI